MLNTNIYFYNIKDPYGELSNFYQPPKREGYFMYEGKEYKTSEHYYQSKKFNYSNASKISLEYAEIIRNAKTPNIAFCLANQQCNSPYPWSIKIKEIINKYKKLNVQIDNNWLDNRDNIMYNAVYYKFKQNPRLKSLLLKTNNSILIEHTTRDHYWADGGDGSGENKLGKILMKVRNKLLNEENKKKEDNNIITLLTKRKKQRKEIKEITKRIKLE